VLEAVEVGNAISKEEYQAAVPQLRLDLVNAQYDLKDADFPVVVLIAGDDRIAANEVVNRLDEWLDSRLVDTHVFADLSQEEAEHPRLWRTWRALPPKGRSAIWAGGLFRAVFDRLDGDFSEEEFDAWIRHLRAMQNLLVAEGALVLKFYLHTPKAVQRKRLKRADQDATLGWRIDQRDWAMLDRMHQSVPLVERVLRSTSVPGAPWTIVESSDARYRDLTVARTLLAALTARLGRQGGSDLSVAEEVFGDLDSGASILSAVDLTQALDKKAYKQRLNVAQAKVYRLSREARERGVSSVLAFEGWDAAGKGGTIRRLTGSLEAGDYRVIPVAAPTPDERQYNHLWRFWRDLPRAGRVTVFDRTWYGRVLVERVEGFATAAQWQRGFDEINDFEEQLVERGTYVAKFWLHISAEEQLARFQAREGIPYKQYKITEEDYRNREKWDEYVQAIDQMVLRTSSDLARWHVIPANDKLFGRVAVLETVARGLKAALRRA